MSNKRYYPPPPYSLEEVRLFSEDVLAEYFQPDSPFKKPSLLQNFLRQALILCISGLENLFRTNFFVLAKNKELSMFSRSNRSLLARLLANKVIRSWDCGVHNTDYVSHYVCNITSDRIVNEDNEILVRAGAFYGHGPGKTMDEALFIAMAESIERYASSCWRISQMRQYTPKELKEKNIPYFIHSYFKPLDSDVDNTVFRWVTYQDLFTGNKFLVPASMTYLYYQMQYSSEPVLIDISSNGVATYSSINQALINALYESFERDGFLMYWLNTLAPQQIDIDSINIPEFREIVSNLKERNFNLYFLDCKTEFNIPVIVSVLIDNVSNAVNVHSVAGLSIDNAIKKLLADNQRIDIDYRPNKPHDDPTKIADLYERMQFWHGGYMREYIADFLTGPSISYEEYKNQFNIPNNVNELLYIKQQLKENKATAMYHVYDSKVAREAGLYVVRALVPELMPVYFTESNKHYEVPRLYTFAKIMGYKDNEISKDELNKTPHPFI